jgi:hypothetical protein
MTNFLDGLTFDSLMKGDLFTIIMANFLDGLTFDSLIKDLLVLY